MQPKVTDLAKTELEEAGESTEGMVESTATLRAEIEALSGVDIMLDNNTFKSTYQIMDELAEKWEYLTDIQQASIIELMAGKHQGNVFASLMQNFDTARDALDVAMNSSGSALKEHEKWSKSLEAQLNKLKAAWQGLSQAFLSSDFLKVALDAVIALIDGLTKLVDTIGVIPTLLGAFAGFKTITNISGIIKVFTLLSRISAKNGGILKFADVVRVLGKVFPNATNGVKGFTSALKALFTTALAHPVISAIAIAVGILTGAFMYQKKQVADLAEEVEELTSKYKQEHEELKKLKGDYDTSNEDSMISKYEKLSKGVDGLGRNISLTADEYSEYQSIVNQIAEQIPSLVSGYDEQGNAILSCKDNINALTKEYEKLIHAQNQEILTNSGDIEKNFENTLKNMNGDHWWSNGHGFFAGLANMFKLQNLFGDYELKSDTVESLETLLSGANKSDKKNAYRDLNFDRFSKAEIRTALESANVDVKWWQDPLEVLKETLKTDPQKIKNIIDDYYEQFAEEVEQQKSIAQSKLSEAFDISDVISGLDYGNISEELQTIAYQTVNSLDFEFFEDLKEKGKTVEQWTDEMLKQLNSIGKDDKTHIETAFDLQTKFNGGEISYGEYVGGLKEADGIIDNLNLKDEAKNQLKISLGLDEDGILDQYNALKNKLADSEKFNIMPSEYESFIDGLSSKEIPVAIDIITELQETDYKETIDDIKAALEREMMLQGLTFDLNLEVETAGLESLNTALVESVSASGLSSESIAALKGRYSDLESQGYDISSMFEETSHGIRLNRQEFNKLENAYATEKLADIDGDLTKMKSTYDDLGEAIKNCDDPIKKSELFNDRQTLAKKISEAATLAHQYKGLTSAYNDWLAAEEAGQERDMYENIIKGFETIDDEISRGWIDDGTIEFLEMLTGQTDLAGKSGKQLKEVYDSLDKTIGNSGYSVRDFFTVNEDGESTNTGVYNFLETVESFEGKLGDVIKRKDGNIIGFDFKVAGGDEVIAETLGISEELVQIMVRAADDAGFVISMDGTYKQLADLQNEARAAANYLQEIGKTDFEFNFNTSSVSDLKTQLEEAHKILDSKEFWNKDGTFNFNADGATQAMQVVSTLQAKLDKLTEEKYGIGLTVEEEKFEEPLEKLQEYGRYIATLNQLELNPKANAKEIEDVNAELDAIAQELIDLSKDGKLDIGIDANDNIEDVKKKIENGEVKIPTVLDIQTNMDKNIEKLADLALLNSGLLSDEQEEQILIKLGIKVEADENNIDTSDVDNAIDNTVKGQIQKDNRHAVKKSIEVLAEVTGSDKIENLSSKIDELDDKTIQTIAEVIGQTDVDKLKNTMALLNPVYVEAIAEAIGKGDIDGLKEAILNIPSQTHVQAIAEALGYEDVWGLIDAIDSLDPKTVQAVAEALGITDVDNLKAAIDNVESKDVSVNATTSGETKLTGLKGLIDSIKSKTVTITSWFKKIVSGGSTRNDSNGFSDVNGTANVDGTTGRAFKQGSWGTKNSGTALVGELGRETLVRDGRYYTIGDTGAEFIKYQRGDIIFNHKQTEELFTNGKVTSGGGRARAFASGTAFSRGTGGFGKVIEAVSVGGGKSKSKTTTETTTKTKKTPEKTTTTTTTTTSSSGSSGSGGGLDKNKNGKAVGSTSDKDKFEETFDWVETAISRIEREIDNLDKKANSVYRSWTERNNALVKEIGKVQEEITLQQRAYDAYMQEANSVGLSSSWAEKVRNGAFDISTITDENLADKIKKYKEFYEKALSCKDAILELQEAENDLIQQKFDNVIARYDGLLSIIGHEKSMLDEYINQSEAQGYLISEKYYDALIVNEQENIAKLQAQKAELLAELNTQEKDTQQWYENVKAIDEITLAIEQANTALLEYAQTIEQLKWEQFDLLQEKISAVTKEADFLIELMSSDKLFDDKGQFTDEGMATAGLHGQNYNVYMHQADMAAKEIERLKAELAKDPYDNELEERYREMISLQQEYILNAQKEKEAIRDLVSDGIEVELDALTELIDKYNESLDSQKDLYEYNKRVEEQTKNIASLRKQLSSIEGDDSEEAKAKIQELKVSLEEAEAELKETEYDKYIADTEKLLDSLYLEYETILNERLDNLDALIADMIDQINANAGTISDTLHETADSVGVELSDAMETTWDKSTVSINSVITTYGEKFSSAQTTTNNALNAIQVNTANMISKLGSIAAANVKQAGNSSVANPQKPATQPTNNNNNKNNNNNGNGNKNITDDTLMGIAAAIWVYGSSSGWGNNPFRENKLKDKIGEANAKKVQQYINSYGSNGKLYDFWEKKGKNLDKYKYNAFKLGAKNIDETQLAWTQEGKKQEFIVRPSDGAILTPIAKGDSVLTSVASKNIWDMANSPAEFIRDNLNFGFTNVPNNSSHNSTITQKFDKIVFSLPNVKNYDELLSTMQKDKNFERLVTSMSIDRLAGKSSLAKGKAIR